VKFYLALLIAFTPTLAVADPLQLAKCQYGIMIAQKAYLSGTFDTRYPDVKHLEYLVDYWADDLALHVNRPVAMRTVRYVAATLRTGTIRRPNEQLVYAPIQQALNAECLKYVDH